jgi:hypothetical protein
MERTRAPEVVGSTCCGQTLPDCPHAGANQPRECDRSIAACQILRGSNCQRKNKCGVLTGSLTGSPIAQARRCPVTGCEVCEA